MLLPHSSMWMYTKSLSGIFDVNQGYLTYPVIICSWSHSLQSLRAPVLTFAVLYLPFANEKLLPLHLSCNSSIILDCGFFLSSPLISQRVIFKQTYWNYLASRMNFQNKEIRTAIAEVFLLPSPTPIFSPTAQLWRGSLVISNMRVYKPPLEVLAAVSFLKYCYHIASTSLKQDINSKSSWHILDWHWSIS